jgi:hypothetical protein
MSESRPQREALEGEKIHVLWAKGKTYAGAVKEYNAVSGFLRQCQHAPVLYRNTGLNQVVACRRAKSTRVRYNDGSARQVVSRICRIYDTLRGKPMYTDHQGTSQVQGPPVDFRSLQATCGRMNRLQAATSDACLPRMHTAYLTRGTASRPPVAPCTTCLHHVCMATWDLRSTS